MSDSVVVPRYYLVHDTPAGARFAYPVPVLEGFPNRSWSGDPEWVSWTSTVAEIEQVGKWLIATGPLGEVTASWLPAKMLGTWRKTENPPADPYSRPAWDAAPGLPTDDELDHFQEHDSDEGCIRCQVFRVIYERPRVQPPPVQLTVDFSGLVPLSGEPDPDPGREWVLHDQSMAAVYGQHTAHLWPGQLPGFRDAVYERLKADPRVAYVFDAQHHPRTQPPGTLETTVPIRWETPRTEMVTRIGVRGQVLRGKQPVPRPVAYSARTTLRVPRDLRAASKAEALDQWDDMVAEYVDRLVPVDVVACDRCDGHGHLLARDVEGE